MDRLVHNGLHGDGLIRIESPLLVDRYNACLQDMDIAPTELRSFGIDAVGWSPDIAKEKGDANYLAHSAANMLAIILLPEQRHCSIWNPFHSFDRDLIIQFFDSNRRQIAELTQRDALWLDIDQEVITYHDPKDLFLVDNIVIRAFTPTRLMIAARKQRALIRELMGEQANFEAEADALLRIPGELKASVAEVGDIAHRSMVIEDMPFTVPGSFYTHAFGGTFVLRSPSGDAETLLSREDAFAAKGVRSSRDKRILKQLESLGLIAFGAERWIESLDRLRVIRDSFLMDVLDEHFPELDYVGLSEVRQKSVLNHEDVKSALPEEYGLLNNLIKHLERGRVPQRISVKIRPYLAHPLEGLDKATKEVVWYVLALVFDGRNVVRLYRYDKDAFFTAYESTWRTPWRTFAVDCIKKYRERRMVT